MSTDAIILASRGARSLTAARRGAAGHSAQLCEGTTHWRGDGPHDGAPIVLLHGATVPSWGFDRLVPRLTLAGFRTLRFDFYGHGLSDRPAGPYSLDRFVRQACELIDTADFPRPAVLLGHSFGAAVAAAVAMARPDWVSRLVLVAPMLDFNATSRWSRLFRIPLAGDALLRWVGIPALVRRRRRRYARIGLPHLTPLFVDQTAHAGFARALLSMMRTQALGDQGARYAALHRFPRGILVITGSADTVIPLVHVARVRDLLPPHLHCDIVGAEHNLLLTHPQAVVDALCGRVTPS